jgi:hypothetical protein
MLKNQLKYLFTFLAAAYFLLAGMGYNVVRYCCQTCANEGIEEVALSSCNSVHKHEHSNNNHPENDDMACADTNHQPSGCHLLRLSIDTPSIQVADNNLIEPCKIIDWFYVISNLISNQTKVSIYNSSSPPETAFYFTGRELMTLHAVFLI